MGSSYYTWDMLTCSLNLKKKILDCQNDYIKLKVMQEWKLKIKFFFFFIYLVFFFFDVIIKLMK